MLPSTFLTEGSDGAYVNLLLWGRSKKLLREAPAFRRGESSPRSFLLLSSSFIAQFFFLGFRHQYPEGCRVTALLGLVGSSHCCYTVRINVLALKQRKEEVYGRTIFPVLVR